MTRRESRRSRRWSAPPTQTTRAVASKPKTTSHTGITRGYLHELQHLVGIRVLRICVGARACADVRARTQELLFFAVHTIAGVAGKRTRPDHVAGKQKLPECAPDTPHSVTTRARARTPPAPPHRSTISSTLFAVMSRTTRTARDCPKRCARATACARPRHPRHAHAAETLARARSPVHQRAGSNRSQAGSPARRPPHTHTNSPRAHTDPPPRKPPRTVSASARFRPTPPARVLSRNTNVPPAASPALKRDTAAHLAHSIH